MGRISALDDDNRTAWLLYRHLCNRFVNDIQASGLALDRMTRDDDAETFAEKTERLRVIYDVLQPPKAP